MYKITDLLPRCPTVSENSLMSAFLGLKNSAFLCLMVWNDVWALKSAKKCLNYKSKSKFVHFAVWDLPDFWFEV